ncbi:unnamed protein product [Aphanomyces euteiches]|uniref:Uncharacterized protein n=1 Tax=Aphanomyces euteiches TaxID=100861 RepID=A0A6G0W7M8_9STRA|nr:hypothetical protein Ae201684_018652 [Aphanomyces euteiches]KAH9071921.1 hypothetical protein Ae201684P_020178 [Aphanomyces euteiches]KAH9156351.1 hypothetical protein AeRB84_001744 [Aphanomyces euteiches]
MNDDTWIEQFNVTVSVLMVSVLVFYRLYTLHLSEAHAPPIQSPEKPIHRSVAQHFWDLFFAPTMDPSKESMLLDQVIDNLLLSSDQDDHMNGHHASLLIPTLYEAALMGLLTLVQFTSHRPSLRSFVKLS